MEEEKNVIPIAFLETQKNQWRYLSAYGPYQLIRINKGDGARFYAYEKQTTKEGEGSSGTVYKAYRVNLATGKLEMADTDQKFAVKIFGDHLDSHAADKEYAYLIGKRFYAEKPLRESGKIYLVMDFAVGEELNVKKFAKDINYSFVETVKAIRIMLPDLNRLHHNTTGGGALVHSDIKPGNTRVLVVDAKVLDARLVDLGQGVPIADDANARTADIGGTPGYQASEIIKGQPQGTKSDIFSLGVMIKELFEEIYPKISPEEQTMVDTLRPVVDAFNAKMRSRIYANRPNTDECLKFFTLLHNYCNPRNADKSEFEALEIFAHPHVVLARQALPTQPDNLLALFRYACTVYDDNKPKWDQLKQAIEANRKEFSKDELRFFDEECQRLNPVGRLSPR